MGIRYFSLFRKLLASFVYAGFRRPAIRYFLRYPAASFSSLSVFRLLSGVRLSASYLPGLSGCFACFLSSPLAHYFTNASSPSIAMLKADQQSQKRKARFQKCLPWPARVSNGRMEAVNISRPWRRKCLARAAIGLFACRASQMRTRMLSPGLILTGLLSRLGLLQC